MFRVFLIWIAVLKQTHTFVLQDSYNILLKDSVHYKINKTINYYEIITNEQITTIQIKTDDKNKFNSLERLVKQEYDKELKYSTAPTIEVFQRTKKLKAEKFINVINISSTPSFSTAIKKVADDNENNYDYDYLNKEFYIETLNAMFSNKNYNISKDKLKFGQSILRDVSLNKKDQSYINKLSRTDNVKKYKSIEDKCETKIQLTRDDVLRICYIIKIWIIVYTAIAVPMWFTRGWCCCCLNCRVFKPQRTIEEVKKYLILYPPGVFNTKKGIIEYEPTEHEKDKYEEFEHFIRTL